MKSSAASKIISRIQFTIYSFFAFAISIIVIFYALLSYGVSIPLIILPHFKAEQLYIKLDKKLILHAKRIDVSLGDTKDERSSLLESPETSNIIHFVSANFQSFKIDELNLDEYKVTFSYTDTPSSPKDNSAVLSGAEINAELFFRLYDEFMILELPHLEYKTSELILSAKSVLEFKTGSSYATATLTLPDCASIQLYAKENGKALAFTAFSNEFVDLEPVVELFGLPSSTSKWIVDYNNAQSYQLLRAQGIYDYSRPDAIIDSLFFHAREKNLEYTFNELLFPLITPEADVYFAKGVLKIEPSEATYNKHLIDKGSVTIDFNGEHIILEVDLNADISLGEDIVEIVEAYKIHLPLLQEKGRTKAHLLLNIDLETEDAYAKGEFFVKKSDLLIDGVRYKIRNAAVRLHKNILNIDTAGIRYKDIFAAKANGQIDLNTLTGDFFFDIDKASLPLSDTQRINLLSPNIRIQQHFSKDSETYSFDRTLWSLGEYNITVDANQIRLPVKFSFPAQIKDLKVHVEGLADFNANGTVDLGRNHADLNISLMDFNYTDTDLSVFTPDKTLPLRVIFDNNVTQVRLLSASDLSFNDIQLNIMPTSFILNNGYLDIQNAKLSLDDQVSTELSTRYQLGSKSVKVKAEKTTLFSDEILFIEPSFDLYYEKRQNEHRLDVKEYGVHAVLNQDKEIDLTLKDLSKIHPYSKQMQVYDIRSGHADLTFIGDRVGMDITIKDFHPLLSKDGKNVTEYMIKGDYQNETANLQINKDLDLLYRKKGKLTAKNSDFNLFPILDYIDMIDTKDEKSGLELIVKTKKCNVSLGSSGRRILADSINIQIKEDKLHAQLIHDRGGVLFESNDNNISVFGHDLNDRFMNELFKFSTFQGGELSFVMQGPFDDMNGIINIGDTVIRDYTVLNNTLAFFNTIPSLITFSVPGYSNKGLKVKEMYSSFHKRGSKIVFNDAKITSKELIITAKGESDFDKETIEMLMQVKTDIGSAAKNIPILGYIIFGKDTVSTTVRVHGDLKDPKVESSVAKSVIVAPYNILKRTIALPFRAFGLFEEDDNESEK